MNRRIFTLLSALILSCVSAMPQAVGSWKTYFSYNHVDQLTDGGEHIYAVSDGNLFALNKSYESIETYTKVQGMNDNDIACIQFNKSLNTLLIVYKNCNIDLFKEGAFFNISDLKRKSISDKYVNSITFDNHLAYLSCGFGIVVVNMQKREIADTYIIGPNATYANIYATALLNDSIFALSKKGIYAAPLKGSNLADYSNWTLLPTPSEGVDQMVGFNGKLVIINETKPLRYDNGVWTELCESDNYKKFTVTPTKLTCFGTREIISFDENWTINGRAAVNGIRDLVCDGKTYWVARYEDETGTLAKLEEGEIVNSYKPIGPFSSSVAFAKIRDGRIITGSGGPFEKPLDTPGVIQIYENGEWTVIRNRDVKASLQNNDINFFDVLDAEFDPSDPRRFYAASWRGLFEFYDKKAVKLHYSDDTPLESVNKELLLVDGLVFDKSNNLWMTNMSAKDLIKVKKADGTWESLYYSEATNKSSSKELFIDSRGMKWVVCPRSSPGVLVVNDNKTPFNNNDDRARWFSSFNEYGSDGVKPVNTAIYKSIAEDKNGAIWIGTEMGPLIINNVERIFSENFYVDRIKITREDNPLFADYLLANEQIEAICVDGANRKWLGTAASGVYLLSEDGQETIHHFTTENSPLTSDCIVDISLNEKTGEVLIASANGLVSYMSDAIEGSDSYDDVYAYPNPVKENYEGDVYVKGLIENSIVRIADIEGNVVHQGISNGGIFSWDCKLLNGQRVKTGVYLVLMTLPDGSEKAVTKIAVIN